MKKCMGCKVVTLLAGIGAFNWLLLSLAGVDLVAAVFGTMTGLAKLVYVVVGVAGLILILSLFMPCPGCKKSS